MDHKEFEHRYIRFLDETPTTIEWNEMLNARRDDPVCAKIAAEHDRVRDLVKSKQSFSFGPEFGSSLMRALQKGVSAFDQEMAFIFKKVYLLVAGVVMCLFIVNAIYADEFSLQSIVAPGDSTSTTPSEEIFLDLSEIINDNQ